MLLKAFSLFVQKQFSFSLKSKANTILHPLCFEKCLIGKKKPYPPHFLFEQNTLQYIAQRVNIPNVKESY